MTEPFITGWRAISRHIGIRDTRALRKYADKYSLPIRRWPGNRPVVIPFELERWLIEFDNRRKELEKTIKSNNATSSK